MTVPAESIKELRQNTGAGILDCRNALEETGGDMEKAAELLKERGLARAAKRADRETSAGVIELYNHGEGRVGVMVEINCETDFVARTEEFRHIAHEMALQIAATDPGWLQAEDVPKAVLEEVRDEAQRQARQDGKSDEIVDRIVEGRLEKFYEDRCLLRQVYIRDDSKSVQEVLQEVISAIGENVVIRRFERWTLGEALE